MSCAEIHSNTEPPVETDTVRPASNGLVPQPGHTDTVWPKVTNPVSAIFRTSTGIETGDVNPSSLVAFSKTLLGVPYLYASADPANGFDCSGFITYVFNHFNIAVPRSSVDFTNVGRELPEQMARPGDLILFTGTDSTIRIVGHMGIVESNANGPLSFIHSTSGKAKGVVITPLEPYYRSRFVKIIRVFPDASFE